jgi:hypothetical protein
LLKSSSLCLCSSNFGTFWFKIEHFQPFEEISIFSNGGLFMNFELLPILIDYEIEKKG